MADRTLNLNVTWDDDDPRVVRWNAANEGYGKDVSFGYCNFQPPLHSSGRDFSFDWPFEESSDFITHPNDPNDPFNLPPQRFDDTLRSEEPSRWGRMLNATWSPLRRREGDANESMFLEDSGLDFICDQSSNRLPPDWPDRRNVLFPNRCPPSWGAAGPPPTPPRSTSPNEKSRVAKSADNQSISYTTERPKIVSRIPRLKPTHNPQPQRPQPPPRSRIPVLAPRAPPAPPAPEAPPPRHGRFPPGMEALLQEGPAAAEACQAMRVHVRGCKGACGGTAQLGGCVMRKYGRI